MEHVTPKDNSVTGKWRKCDSDTDVYTHRRANHVSLKVLVVHRQTDRLVSHYACTDIEERRGVSTHTHIQTHRHAHTHTLAENSSDVTNSTGSLCLPGFVSAS